MAGDGSAMQLEASQRECRELQRRCADLERQLAGERAALQAVFAAGEANARARLGFPRGRHPILRQAVRVTEGNVLAIGGGRRSRAWPR